MEIILYSVNILFSLGLFINAMLFIPQMLKLYRSKDSKELSKIMFVGFCFMQLSAILYGILHHDWILTVGYSLALLTCGSVTFLIYRYR